METLKSVIGVILNSKQESEGKEAMSDVKFYQRIEREICHLQDFQSKADTREALRVLSLTYQSQKKHFVNWEKVAVELGFARDLLQHEQPEVNGYVV